MMAKTLYKISTIDEEKEGKDDEEWLPSIMYQKSLCKLTYTLINNK